MHPALQFKFEGEENNQILYLDPMVMRKNNKILTTVFRKLTFFGQYLKWNLFCHDSRKIHLTKTLILQICCKSLFEPELDFIKSVFSENGYSLEVIQSSITVIQLKQKKELVFGRDRCPVYLKLPYISSSSKWFRAAVE